MFYRHSGKVHGVLNDFDLSILDNDSRKYATERTGTMPFIAYKLLRNPGGVLPHIYGVSVSSSASSLIVLNFGQSLMRNRLAGY